MPPRCRVALIADAHFHDPTGDFGAGVADGARVLAYRPWSEARAAGRSVNDSAHALRAALDRIAAQGIRQVVLAGDYSDDGQAENLTRLAALLHEAEARLGLRIHAIPGNHDGYGVAGKHVAQRIATAPGLSQMVTSDPDLVGARLTGAMHCPGWPAALDPLAAFGQRRRAGDLHWESPFGASDHWGDRRYLARSADGSVAHWLVDASCLVEPEPGLWLLLLDATVFEPRDGITDPRRKRAFHDPALAGWAAVLRVKPFLIDWIADVMARGRAAGKLVVPVSHYPALAHLPDLQRLLPGSALVRRSPGPEVAARLAAAGMRLHFGGHLHMQGRRAEAGVTDIMLPSSCAFPAAVTVIEGDIEALSMRHIVLGDLPHDPPLAAFLRAEGAPDSASLGQSLHTRARERLLTRRLARELPADIWAAVQAHRLADLPALMGADACALPDQPLTDLVITTVLLAEGGALARADLTPAQVAGLRALSSLRATRDDPLALWLAGLLHLLDQALDAELDPEAGAAPIP